MAINVLNAGVPIYSPIRLQTQIESDREPADQPIEESAEKSAASDSTHKGKQPREPQSSQLSDGEKQSFEQAHSSPAGQGAVPVNSASRSEPSAAEFSIDTSPIQVAPAATMQQTERIRQAALAPEHASSRAMQVAARGAQMAQDARLEMSRENSEATSEKRHTDNLQHRSSKQEVVAAAFQSTVVDPEQEGSTLDLSI